MEGMDYDTFIADRELLGRLSREYELLKASGADVDMAAWVQMRLREAAADLAEKVIETKPAVAGVQNASLGANHDSDPAAEPGDGTGAATDGQQREAGDSGASAGGRRTEQLFLTRAPALQPSSRLPRPPPEVGPGGLRPETAWFVRGEGGGPASEALATAIYGPSGQVPASALRMTPTKSTKGTKKQKRVVIVSPRRSPAQSQRVPTTTQVLTPLRPQPQAQAPPPSKLYTRVEPGLFASRPDAYVHPEARPRRSPLAASRPDWVNAASLQAALRGASSAVPHLQAAADRERRLALSTALARQTLAAGLGQDDARAVAMYGTLPATTAATSTARAAHAQYDHVLQVAQLLAQQNEQLARAVQLNSQQLAEQQALLQSTMQPHLAETHGGDGDDAGSGAVANGIAPAMRVEVESGPPAWFASRRTRGTAATHLATAAAVDGGGGARGKHPNGRSRSKSPGADSGISSRAAAHASRALSLPADAAMTAKERERVARKESLKELLRQVLDGVGLSGGREGQRRLASGVAEAEKLVAAIQALARFKGTARRGATAAARGVGQGGIAAAATQTSSGRVSPGGEGSRAAALDDDAAPAAPSQPGPSRTSSRARALTRARSGGLAAGAGGRGTSAPSSRNLSCQGSGLSPKSSSERYLADAGLSDGRAGAGGGQLADGGRGSPGSEGPSTRSAGAAPSAGAESASYTPPSLQGSDFSAGSHPQVKEQSTEGAEGIVPNKPVAHDVGLGSNEQGVPDAGAAHNGAAPVPPTGAVAAAAGAAAGAGGPARGVAPGVMVESLEDQVQQIVERDAVAWADAARLRKIDALEQRLHSMVDKVENKLARVLQPLQLNTQPLQQGGLVGPREWELQLGPDGQPMPGGGPGGAAATLAAGAKGASAAGGAPVIAAGSAGRGGGEGGGGGYQDGSGVYGSGIVSPRSAGLSVLELQRMLIQLNRMESKEQEVRRKWFHDVRDPKHHGHGPRPIVVRDGQIGTLDRDEPPTSPPPVPSPTTAAPDRPASPPPRGFLWFAHPPTESALATVATDSRRRALASVGVGPGAGPGEGFSTQAQDGTAAADESLADPISDATLESVLQGRRRFLRAQKLADGDLVAAAEPSLNPVQIMEDVTDALLDEVLREQAQEMVGLCDTLGEHMVKDEFDLDADEQQQRERRSPPRSLSRSLPKRLF